MISLCWLRATAKIGSMAERSNPYAAAERAFESHLLPNCYAVVRVDGKAFHTFTKQFEAPFSIPFSDAMNAAAVALCKAFSGVRFAYVQSDEISLVLSDLSSPQAELPYGGRVQKISSTAAATATGAFLRALPDSKGLPVFDGRVFSLADAEQALEYIEFRRADARKNAVSMAAHAYFSHRELAGKSTFDRQRLLEGLGIERLPEEFYHGRFILPTRRIEDVTWVRDGVEHRSKAERRGWDTMVANLEAVDKLAF